MQGAEYEKKITVYNWDNLLDLWKGIESGNTPGWESGKALEYLILRVFQLGASRFYKLPSDWKSGAAQTKPASAGWH